MLHVFKCVRCGNEWTDTEEESFRLRTISESGSDENYRSHGVCPECYRGPLRQTVQNHQNKNYGHSCFLTVCECENNECGFRFACRTSSFQQWQRTKV
jgi:hypothetical protein